MHQAFQVLGRGCQQELLGYIPQPSESDSLHSHSLLKFGKQSLDLVASSSRTFVSRCARQGPRHLSGWFIPVNEKLAIGSRCTPRFLRTPLALGCGRTIGGTALGAMLAAIAQRFSFRTVVDVLRRIVTKLVAGEVSTGLMATIDDRNVGR